MFVDNLTKLFLITMLIFFGSCSSNLNKKILSSESIIFSTIGKRPFDDFTYNLSLQDFNVKTVFAPNSKESFLSVSVAPLNETWAVSKHWVDGKSDEVIDSIFLRYSKKHQWVQLSTLVNIDLKQNEAFISPDGTKLILTLIDIKDNARFSLWLVNLQTSKIELLVNADKGNFLSHISWNPNNKEIVFIEATRTSQGLVTKLRRANIETKQISNVFDESVAGACYGPQGDKLAIWTKNGLEIMDLISHERFVVFPSEQLLDNYIYNAGNIIWSPYSDLLAFPLENLQTGEQEIWIVGSNGQGQNKIYSLDPNRGQILVNAFIRPE